MAKCRKCGRDTYSGGRLCLSCLDKWKDRRMRAYDQAKAEMGSMSQENLEAFKKRVKKLEREMAKGQK